MWTDATTFGGMVPWACSYRIDGILYGITLYGTDPVQIIEDNCDLLPDLTVEGQIVATSDAGGDQ